MVDDAAEGQHPRPETGTIVVKIYRVKVTGPWQGKWQPSKHEDAKPVLVSEKSKTLEADTRVGYPPSTLYIRVPSTHYIHTYVPVPPVIYTPIAFPLALAPVAIALTLDFQNPHQ